MKHLFIYFIFSAFMFTSCNEENIFELNPEETQNTKITQNGTKAAPIVSQYFDWENDTYIWYNSNQLLLPWASTNTEIPLEIKPDFKKVDGWRLLYNTFMLNESDPFFALYNVYTGLVRIYIYPTNQQYPNNTYTFGLGIATTSGNETSAMNFTWPEAKSSEDKQANPYVYKPGWNSNITSTPYGIQNNYWYYNEFEIAYDPNIKNLSRGNLEMQLRMLITNKSYTESQGSITGTIEGTFTMPNSGSSGGILSSIASQIKIDSLVPFKINVPTKEGATKFLQDQATKQANSTLKNLINTGLSQIGNPIKTSNPILGLVSSAIFSPKSYSPGTINLDFNAKTKESGTITTSYTGPSKGGLIYPGLKVGTTNIGGILPHYDTIIGVWNIDQRPIVRYGYTYYDAWDPYRRTAAMLDQNSYNVIINDALTNNLNANVRIVSKDLILYDKSKGALLEYGGTLINSSGDYTYKGQKMGVISGGSPRPSAGKIKIPLKGIWRVRITIAIKPEGNTDEIILIKEFEPTLLFDSNIY